MTELEPDDADELLAIVRKLADRVEVVEVVELERLAELGAEWTAGELARDRGVLIANAPAALGPLLVDRAAGIVQGASLLVAARGLGIASLPAVYLDELGERERRAFVWAGEELTAGRGRAEDLDELGRQVAELEDGLNDGGL